MQRQRVVILAEAGRTTYGDVLDALSPLLPAGESEAYRLGMFAVGGLGASTSATFADIEHLLRPGLAALSIASEWAASGDEDATLRRPRPSLYITFARAVEFRTRRIVEPTEERRLPAPPEILAASAGAETRSDGCTYRLLLTRGVRRGGRADNRRAALLRWLTCMEAWPERAPMTDGEDARVRARAAASLRELAGRRHTPDAVALRRAVASCESANPPEWAKVVLHLRSAVVPTLGLPVEAADALLTPDTAPLNFVERQELLYLARAGTTPLRILAARRLRLERSLRDARATLEQLAYDADPYVRAAARFT